MKKWMTWFPVLALTCLLAAGCGGKDEKKDEKEGDKKEAADTGDSDVTNASFACTACGDDVADGCKCESDDATKCESCGLVKGTALCCKVSADELASLEGKKLCLACGHVAEDGHKCDESHETCEKCKVHKDSILCKCDESS